MNEPTKSIRVALTPEDNERLVNLSGQFNQHLQQLEKHFDVQIHQRGYVLHITGAAEKIKEAKAMIQHIYRETEHDKHLTPAKIHRLMMNSDKAQKLSKNGTGNPPPLSHTGIRAKTFTIKPCNANQERYLENIAKHDINFGIGPAGTGKTYLAVACAVAALEAEQVKRLVLVRPAVEAGEKLGFLPGDLVQKVNPYLRPLYDALYEMMGTERVLKLIENDIIEIAPLAYMRGRTLNDAFIIMDEGQNTTLEQMKMFLTRIGFGSKVIVTGDITQIDLPRSIESGLAHATKILRNVPGISMSFFESRDVVRHPLVRSIIDAYERHARPQ